MKYRDGNAVGLSNAVREAFTRERADLPSRIGFGLLLLFGAFAPFLYEIPSAVSRSAMGGGATNPRSDFFLELFVFILVAVALFSRTRSAAFSAPAVPLTALLLLAALGVIQILLIPENLLRIVAPGNLKIYHDSADILNLFNRRPHFGPRISIAPSETAGSLLLLLAYGGIFLASNLLLDTRPRRRLFLGAVFVGATIQVVAPLPRDGGPGHRLHGAFVNPNHFAAYLEVVLMLSFAVVWKAVLTSADRAARVGEAADRLERKLLPIAGGVFLWALIALGIGLTESRGGILSAGITTLVLATLAAFQAGRRAPLRAAAGVGIALLTGVLIVAKTAGGEPFLRFLKLDPRDLGGNLRVALWKTSIAAWQQFPFLGSGLGTFREAFRRVQPRDLEGLVEQAHSDSLQLLVTGGLLGAMLGIVLFGSLFVLFYRAWKRQRHREEGALILASFGALLSLTLHGLVDFNLSIPPVPTLLASTLGCGWAASAYTRHSRRRRSRTQTVAFVEATSAVGRSE